jgi:hypothetical protein
MSMQHSTNGSARFDTRSWITLRWIRGTRYYRVHLEQDLWCHWLLTQVNGRVGTPRGRARAKPAPTIEPRCLSWRRSPGDAGGADMN